MVENISSLHWLGWVGTICWMLFILLCLLVSKSVLFNKTDRQLHNIISGHSGKLVRLIAIIADPKVIIGWTFLLAFVLIVMNRMERAVWTVGTIGLLDVFGIWIKHAIKRTRPSNSRTTYSFPSGHTLGTTILGLIIGTVFPLKMVWLCIVIVWLLVVWCRLSLQVHYLSDTLAATFLAIGWYCFAEILFREFIMR